MSSFISGTYASYKAGTTKVLNWLWENAQKCTPQVDEEGDEENEKNKPKNKTKSKPKPKPKKGQGSKAKGSGKAKSKKPTIAPQKYVPVREFPALAEVIANSEEKIPVPSWVISTIKEVIQGRKKSARWFSRQSGDTTTSDFEESNKSHQHFIGILENVLSILRTCVSSEKASSEEEAADGDGLGGITNIFEALDIEPDTEHTMTEPTEPLPSAGTKIIYEEEPSIGETLWLIYCFFEDFNVAREHLKDLWTSYKYGAVDLTAVSLATNTMFLMLSRAEEDLMKELKSTLPANIAKRLQGYEMVQGILHQHVADQRGQNLSRRIHPDDPYNYALFDIADWTCLHAYIILDSFLPIWRIDAPVCKPGYFGKLNMKEEILNPREKFAQDKIVLLEMFLPELKFLSRIKGGDSRMQIMFPGQDELTTGILKMGRTKELPIWLILAIQIHLDIHYVLLEDTSRAQNELFTGAKRTVDTLKEYLEFSKNMHIANWPAQNNMILRAVLEQCENMIINDFIDGIRTEAYDILEMPEHKGGTFVLMKRHPVLCGMLLFRLHVIMQGLGITLVNAWGSLTCVLHLYNAAYSEGTLSKPWIDMEAVILANTAERIFIGGRPQKPQDYFKKFLLAMGLSASSFSANKRLIKGTTGPTASQKGPRQMIAQSSVVEVYQGQYLTYEDFNQILPTKKAEFTLSAIEKLLQGAADDLPLSIENHTSDDGDETGIEAAVMGSLRSVSDSKENTKQQRVAKQFKKSNRLTSIQLLKALEICITKESLPLNIDYFSLHRRCYTLLRSLAAELDSAFIKCFGPDYIDKESQLPFMIVSGVLQIVSGSSQAAEKLFSKIDTDQISSKILIQISKVMEVVIEKEGNAEVNKVAELCKAFLGIEVLPQH